MALCDREQEARTGLDSLDIEVGSLAVGVEGNFRLSLCRLALLPQNQVAQNSK